MTVRQAAPQEVLDSQADTDPPQQQQPDTTLLKSILKFAVMPTQEPAVLHNMHAALEPEGLGDADAAAKEHLQLHLQLLDLLALHDQHRQTCVRPSTFVRRKTVVAVTPTSSTLRHLTCHMARVP